MTEQIERLAAAGIQLVPLPAIATHYIFERDGFAALVERAGAGFGQIGSAGLITEHGLAALVWRGPDAFFIAKAFERRATEVEVETLRRFSADLEHALHP
ncbi:MAG: hypothetical protein KIT09_28615 [Bryobacteraceae bacterium]|nr:hypothetical protein [Bryobacteraceae bacterium]